MLYDTFKKKKIRLGFERFETYEIKINVLLSSGLSLRMILMKLYFLQALGVYPKRTLGDSKRTPDIKGPFNSEL